MIATADSLKQNLGLNVNSTIGNGLSGINGDDSDSDDEHHHEQLHSSTTRGVNPLLQQQQQQQHHLSHVMSGGVVGYPPQTVNPMNKGPSTTSASSSSAANQTNPLHFLLEDIRRMEVHSLGSIEENILRSGESMKKDVNNPNGMGGVGGIGTGTTYLGHLGNSASSLQKRGNESIALTPNTLLASLIGRNGSCCLLTDSHDFYVRHHQLRILCDEFVDIDFIKFIESCSRGGMVSYNAITVQLAPKIKTLLLRLADLERAYADNVFNCKQKDYPRAQDIITGLADRPNEIDDTITRARIRAEEISICVHRVVSQL
jgi:hypothetical protein